MFDPLSTAHRILHRLRAEMAASLVDQVNAIGSFILQLSNPHVSPATRTSVTASLPVMRFHEAALLAAGYLLMVAYGWWVMPSRG